MVSTESSIVKHENVQPFLHNVTHPYHTWIEISLANLHANIAYYKQIVGPHVALAAVVKSNAYGHGLLEIARACDAHPDIAWLCTASLSEGYTLRTQGITKPILALSYLDISLDYALNNAIDIVVHNQQTLQYIQEYAQAEQKQMNVHLKIDTGLTRLGFDYNDAFEIIRFAHAQLHNIRMNGIFSHFSDADSQDNSYTQLQLSRFQTVIDACEQHNIHIPFKHISNTAAAITSSRAHCNLVRLGAGLYGLSPSEHVAMHAQENHGSYALKPVLQWKTYINAIKKTAAGSFVGYNKTFQTQQDSTIAIVPIGYYEGYDRRLSNKGAMLVRCRKTNQYHLAPVVGRVCMNVTMIDITHIPDVSIGDEVTIIGDYPQIQAQDIATTIESYNPREITTRLNPLIKRMIL